MTSVEKRNNPDDHPFPCQKELSYKWEKEKSFGGEKKKTFVSLSDLIKERKMFSFRFVQFKSKTNVNQIVIYIQINNIDVQN